MSYWNTVWQHLLVHGSVTSKEIEDMTGTVCPHDVIRQIRRKFGYDILEVCDTHKTVKAIDNGKEISRHNWHRKWFLKKLEGI